MWERIANQVSIVGIGLLGGSIALGIRQKGFGGKIIGVARKPDTLGVALEAGQIDVGTSDLGEGVYGSDLIILATPVNTIIRQIGELGDLADPQAVITDVGSTKASIVTAAEERLVNPGRFVGAHPMAGGEASGPAAARADLFRGRPVVLTPTSETREEALGRVRRLYEKLEMKILEMTPTVHDVKVARVSHLPHALAVALVSLADTSGSMDLASSGFGDISRLAEGHPDIWTDIFLDNDKQVVSAIDQFLTELCGIKTLIESGDREALGSMLAKLATLRQAWRKAKAYDEQDSESDQGRI